MDQRPGLPEKMRDEHSGNEGISCPLSSGREHDHETKGNAFQKAGNAARIHPGAGEQHRLYRLEAEFLR